jgi:hypothetical protein
MAGQTLTGFDAALKEVYGPRIEEQLNIVNVLSDWIDENDSEDWTGRVKKYPLHIGRNQGVGASAEGDPLPAAGAQSYVDVSITAKYNFGRVQLTGQVIKASLQNKGAFTRAMEAEVKGLVTDLANDRERQQFGAGNGVLCLVNGAQCMTNSKTLTIDSPYGVTPTTNGARFLNPDMICSILDPTTATTIEGTISVSSIPAAGTTVVLSGTQSTTFSNNARIVRGIVVSGITTDGSKNNFNNEVVGLLGIIDDGTYANTLSGVNRTTYPQYKSTVISSVGQLTLDVIQQGIDASDELGGGNFGNEGVFFCHHSVRREYLKLLQADRRYAGADLSKPDGGTKQAALKKGGEITYGDRPWKIAKHAPYGTLFGTLKGSIVRHILIRGEWADEDERIFRNVAGYDKWEAFYRIWDQMHADRPNESFRLDGITATVGTPNHVY